MKGQLDKHIKESLENFEVDYNAADWKALERKLDTAAVSNPTSKITRNILIAASVILASGLFYYFSTESNSVNAPKDVVEKTSMPVVSEENTQIQNADPSNRKINLNNQHAAVNSNKEETRKVENNNVVLGKSPEVENNQKKNEVLVSDNKNTPTVPTQTTTAQKQETIPVVLSASFQTSKRAICEGEEVQFLPAKNEAVCSYKWYFGDGQSSTEASPKHIYKEAGSFTVKLQIISEVDRKKAEEKNNIIVSAAPDPRINTLVSAENELLVNFDSDYSDAADWKWDFGDKQTSFMPSPSHSYKKYGSYKVTLYVKNQIGCVGVVVKEVNLKNELDLLAPNAFSPDGNGINDTWMPITLQSGDYEFTITISDAQGLSLIHI